MVAEGVVGAFLWYDEWICDIDVRSIGGFESYGALGYQY